VQSEHILSIVVGVVLVVGVLYVVVWPQVRRAMLLRSGRTARAVVKKLERSHIKDENKRYLHAMVLEVHVENTPPYEVTLTELLPWLSGEGTGLVGTDFEVRVHPSNRSWVTVVGPMRKLPG